MNLRIDHNDDTTGLPAKQVMAPTLCGGHEKRSRAAQIVSRLGVGESIAAVTGSAGALKGVARQAGALIESGYAGMRSVFEKRQRDVSSGQLIVAAVTV